MIRKLTNVFRRSVENKAIYLYKITKIVRALWLAERSVCMRVCKHGCGVKLFGFSRANHASTNLKKFSSSKLDKFTLFTHSFVGWNLENRCEESVSIVFRLSWDFKREKSVMQTLDFVSGLHNCLEFSQPLSCLYQAMQTRKTFSIA